MFNYLLNWDKIIKENLPSFLQKVKRIQFITSLIKPLKLIYIEFDSVKTYYTNRVAHNARTIYFEKILNDTFDLTGRGIYITDDSVFNANYLYLKAEGKPIYYLYQLWDAAINYVLSQFSVENNRVNSSMTSNVNSLPSANPSDWLDVKPVIYLKTKSEYTDFRGFVVNIPIALIYDDKQMEATINYYRLRGVLYTINKY